MAVTPRDLDPRFRSARYGVALLAVTVACCLEILLFSTAPLLSLTPCRSPLP
jgi:hypothetical protein